MIVCGWCNTATAPDLCSYCGRDPALPWTQRGTEPPEATEGHESGGRPALDASQVRQRIRIARKELPDDATQAQLAEALGISERTLARWQKLAG